MKDLPNKIIEDIFLRFEDMLDILHKKFQFGVNLWPFLLLQEFLCDILHGGQMTLQPLHQFMLSPPACQSPSPSQLPCQVLHHNLDGANSGSKVIVRSWRRSGQFSFLLQLWSTPGPWPWQWFRWLLGILKVSGSRVAFRLNSDKWTGRSILRCQPLLPSPFHHVGGLIW